MTTYVSVHLNTLWGVTVTPLNHVGVLPLYEIRTVEMKINYIVYKT